MKKIFSIIFSSLLLFSFVSINIAQVPTRAGWWKFDDTTHIGKATIGTDLQLVGTQQGVAGPTADNNATRIGVGSYYVMTHGITPSPDSLVNEYTLQFDFRVKDISYWHCFYQTDNTNTSDGECFIDPNGFVGVRATGYSTYAINPNEWYRLVVSVKNGIYYKYYLDGQLLLDGVVQNIDDRFSLEKTLLVFADNDGDDGEIDCAEVSIWNKGLTSGQIKLLGGYGHQLPTDPMQPADLWKFDSPTSLTDAFYGNDLTLVGTDLSVDGPTAVNKAVQIGVGSYFEAATGISPNGGGTMVNEYTLKFDFKVPDIDNWRTFFQTDTTNTSDGDCFINKQGQIGTQATGYGAYSVKPNEWYRLVISVKNGSEYKYYLDGQLLLNATVQDVDGRFALENKILLFADNDGDDGVIDIAETAIWDRALSETEVKQLAGFGHDLSGGTTGGKALVGDWTFDNPFSLLEANGVGKSLLLVGTDESVDGPTTTNFAARIGIGSYFIVDHGMGSNGGGLLTNEYSIRIDFRAPSIEKWHCFFQTDSTNTSDGDCFINPAGNIGVQATGYSSYAVTAGEWYRMVVSVQNGTQYLIYLDGTLALTGTIQQVDGRFGLEKKLLMFADNDGEDDDIDCAEFSIYNYALTQAEVTTLGGFGHLVGVEKTDGSLPMEFSLSQNYPNPFNPTTKINYAMPTSGNVSIKIYDILGKEVSVLQNGYQNAGYHTVAFDGSKLSSGVYIYRMVSGNFYSTKKFVLLK